MIEHIVGMAIVITWPFAFGIFSYIGYRETVKGKDPFIYYLLTLAWPALVYLSVGIIPLLLIASPLALFFWYIDKRAKSKRNTIR